MHTSHLDTVVAEEGCNNKVETDDTECVWSTADGGPGGPAPLQRPGTMSTRLGDSLHVRKLLQLLLL